jgi:SP family facilitated glucose transporter-like MFS transporter 8
MPLFVAGSLLIGGGHAAAHLFAGRLMTGAAVGVVSVATPMYLAEVAPPALRGALGSSFQLAVVSGLLLAYVVGLLLVHRLGWRALARAGALPAALLGLLAPLLPESPRWLAMQPGRAEEVEVAVMWLHGQARPAGGGKVERRHAPVVWAELQELARLGKANGVAEVGGGGGWEWSWAGPMATASLLMAFQQISGINAVNMFAGQILAEAGVGSADAAAIGLAMTHIIGTSICISIIDNIGRRPLLATASGGMGAAAVALYLGEAHGALPALSVAALVAYIFSFALGVGALPFVMAAELLPQRARGLGQATATVVNWGTSWAVTASFAPLQNAVGKHEVFVLYSVACFAMAAYVLSCVPETSGRLKD